ncbi:MAG: phage tail tape measure protein [Clostridia bacterium]|nr:phage tail tape measure protein [Clostridia bacterium]
MSETLRDLVVSLSLQTDNFTRNIKSVNKQIQEAESRFRLAAAGVEGFERTTEGLTSRLTTLDRRLSLQKDAVAQYERALSAANDKLTECYHRQNDYAQRLETAKAAQLALKEQVAAAAQEYRTLSASLGENDAKTVAAKVKLDQLKVSYKDSVQEVKKLTGQNTALAKSAQNAADAVSVASANLNQAKAAAKLTEAEIEKCNKSLQLAQTNWDAAGDAINESHAAISTFAKQIGLAESRFKLATAGIKNMDASVTGLSAKLVLLRDTLTLQERSVAEYEKALQSAKEQLKAAQEAHDPEKIRQASDAVIDAEAALNRAQAAVHSTRAAISQCNKDLATAQSAWTAAGKSLDAFGKKCDSVSKVMASAGRTLSTVMTAPILTLGASAIKASVSYESAFASVRKTVNLTEAEYAALSGEIKHMSTEVASSADNIAEVVAIAGQLGIETDYLTNFARTMIDLGNSTDIVADEAASTLAKFANITGMDQSQFGNLGAALVDLGNNYATTESAIMNMAMRLAAAGDQVGLSEAQILGFAAALSSVGIEAEMGGSAFSKALVKMEVAAATGGEALDDFAAVSGMTAQQFKALWDSDPAAAFQSFIAGLSRMDEEGMSAIATLNEIGIAEIRLRDTLLRATNATELFAATQITANSAWDENVALTDEAGKRYATTASKLTNLKNKAVLFGQQIGDDLNPTIHELIEGADDLLDSFLELDEAQRMQIIQFAGVAAAAGPVLLALGNVTKGIGTISTGIGKFATAVGKAGGGIKGFMSVLGSSPAIWLAIAAATITATVAIADYVSGAKQARQALEGMEETAKNWKDTAADTFYGKSDGLSFFGMSESDFIRDTQTAKEWMMGLLAVWTDGQKESDEIVSQWTSSFKALTASTREELEELRSAAQQGGYTSVADQLSADIGTLGSLDAEIGRLLKKRQNGYFSEGDKTRLQELIDTREAIEIKYNLSPADVDGFDTIRQKLEAEVARAQARGRDDADVTVYENALVAAAEGLAAVNAEIDAQYDKEYGLIQLIEDSAERQAAMDALNAKYNTDRRNAALEYAALLSDIVMPVWEQEDIQQAATDVDLLTQKLREYSAASETEKPALLEDLNELTAQMDEGAITEYIAMLTQIQSLLDSGMSEAEVQAMFPEIDFSTALEQIASIQAFLNNRELELPGLTAMFGDALPEEVLKIATDLDMTGVQTRWAEFAADPGAITTEAVISEYKEDQATIMAQPKVDAFIAKYTEIPEGASTAELTPEGLIAYIDTYAEATTGADVSGLTPQNVTAMVSAYKELAAGADVSALTPDEITAYIAKYLEESGVDTTGLTPDGITAFVLAYEEVSGGALTTALTPDNITAMVAKYLEAENVDISALSPDQVEALVGNFAEATNCDKSTLLQNFTAYIAKYDDTNAVKPTLSMSVGIYGYDLIAYRKFIESNPVEVQGIVKLGEVFANPSDALLDPQTKFWQDGQAIPVEAVPTELLTADKVAVLDEDGTIHVMIAPDVTGAQEAIDALRNEVAEVDQFGVTALGQAAGLLPTTSLDLIESALDRIETAKGRLGQWWNFLFGGDEGIMGTLDTSMKLDFPAERIAELSTYVGEIVAAVMQGQQVKQEDLTNLQTILTFLQELDTTETGTHILEGVGEGMTAAGWDTDAETVASNLEAALNLALGIQSPSTRVKPTGEQVAAGVGAGMAGYDFTADAGTVASSVETAVQTALPGDALASLGTAAAKGLSSAMTTYSMSSTGSSVASNVRSTVNTNLTATTLRPIGINAMAGLKAGINAGRSGVISAMRSAARAAVNAAKSELKINSPSVVFEDEVGVMTMRGFGRGVLKESKEQAKVIRNASRYLTGEARDGAIVTNSSDNRRTYNQNVSSTIQVAQMVIRNEQDIRSLAVEIATLTRRQQRGKGLRLT